MKKDDFYQKSIEELQKHAQVANEEMGDIKIQITEINGKIDNINQHVSWIKEIYDGWEKKIAKLDDRTWYILTAIVLGILIQILLKLYLE